MMVLNNPPAEPGKRNGGFCYRCVFPKPPPAQSVLSCGEGGILGPVVGVMGVLMAVETIKILVAGVEPTWSAAMKTEPSSQTSPLLLLYSAYGSPLFRSIRLRGKRDQCPACSDNPTITRTSLTSGSLDYATFCGVAASAHTLDDQYRISAKEYSRIREEHGNEDLLIDVREAVQFDLCQLENSINIPYSRIAAAAQDGTSNTSHRDILGMLQQYKDSSPAKRIYCICRYGNDSQLAVQAFHQWSSPSLVDADIKGGLRAWRKEVDPTFPEY